MHRFAYCQSVNILQVELWLISAVATASLHHLLCPAVFPVAPFVNFIVILFTDSFNEVPREQNRFGSEPAAAAEQCTLVAKRDSTTFDRP